MGQRSRAVFDRNFQIVAVSRGQREEICEADDFAVIRAAFDAATTRYTDSRITLKQGARVIEVVQTGYYDSASNSIPVLSRER